VCKSDDFTRRLMEIFESTRTEAARDDAVLAVLRSDYMLDEPTGGLLQVELNTIASSFGCLSTMVARMHKHLVEFAGLQVSTRVKNPPRPERLSTCVACLGSWMLMGDSPRHGWWLSSVSRSLSRMAASPVESSTRSLSASSAPFRVTHTRIPTSVYALARDSCWWSHLSAYALNPASPARLAESAHSVHSWHSPACRVRSRWTICRRTPRWTPSPRR